MSFFKRIVEKLRNRKMPTGIEVEKRKTAWERVLHGNDLDETRWEKLKRWFYRGKEET